MIDDYIKNNKLKVIVKPNSIKTEILGYDNEKHALKIAIAAQPEDNKANIELIRFLKKLTKKDVRIKTGLRGREKIIEFL